MSALLSFEPSLRRALFDLVVSTACTDPMMGDVHLDAVRGVQVAIGLVDDDIGVLAPSTTTSWRELGRATDRERSIAFTAAMWIALADDVIDDAEARFLESVRRALSLSEPAVRLAESIAKRAIVDARTNGVPSYRAFDRLVVDVARHDVRRQMLRAA